MTKKALLYARVSTTEQKDNSSLEGQLKRTRAYAVEKGYTIIDAESEIISGKFVLARTVLNRFFEYLGDGLADVIIVDVPDRLGRDDAIGKCELLAEMNGGCVEYTSKSYDPDSIEGVVMHHARGITGGVERIKTRERTIEGKKAYAQKGRIIASSFRPYGYMFDRIFDPATGKKIDCKLVVVEDEAGIVKQMFEWCAYEGLTTYGIAKRLSDQKIPTISDKDGGRRKRSRYGIWHKDTVHGMLTNTTYKGEWRYNKNRIKRRDGINGTVTEQSKRDESEQIPVPVPSIVSEELWQLTQKQIAINKKRNFKPTRYKYLLRGKVRCGSCGGGMTGHTQARTGFQAYRCIAKYAMGRIDKHPCHPRNLKATVIEAAVWQFITIFMTNEDLLFSKISEQQAKSMQSSRLIKMNIAALQVQSEKDEAAVKRFLDLYGDGELSKKQFLQKRAQKQDKIDRRKSEIADLKQHLRDATLLPPDREAQLRQLQEKISQRLDTATFEQKQELFELLQLQCTYYDDTGRAVVTGVFGSQQLEVNLGKSNGEAAQAGSDEEVHDVGNTCRFPMSS